jgi:DNA-binding IclR family transcriptional regulator
MREEDQGSNGSPAVGRALRILELLSERDGSLRMTDMADELGLPKSSMHHLLAALEKRGWIERVPANREFVLGIRAWEVGRKYGTAQTLGQRAQAEMDRVRDDLEETVRLAVRSGRENVLIAKSQGKQPLVFDQPVGARLPAYATGLGKALLLGLSPAELDELYAGAEFEPFTENTNTSLKALRADLARSRARGWAEDAGEYMLGVRCVAVPVLAADGSVVAALSVSAPTVRLTDERLLVIKDALLDAATAINSRFGSTLSVTE